MSSLNFLNINKNHLIISLNFPYISVPQASACSLYLLSFQLLPISFHFLFFFHFKNLVCINSDFIFHCLPIFLFKYCFVLWILVLYRKLLHLLSLHSFTGRLLSIKMAASVFLLVVPLFLFLKILWQIYLKKASTISLQKQSHWFK